MGQENARKYYPKAGKHSFCLAISQLVILENYLFAGLPGMILRAFNRVPCPPCLLFHLALKVVSTSQPTYTHGSLGAGPGVQRGTKILSVPERGKGSRCFMLRDVGKKERSQEWRGGG
jgi:hypothetical protein